MAEDEHYLEREVYSLVNSDRQLFTFVQEGLLDGMWYQDLENPEQEWMSDALWALFGYDPATRKHLAAEWHEIVNQDDLGLLRSNFEEHCRNPKHPFDQIVRFRHKDGSTVWVRRRGIAIRDTDGIPKRMLGAHIDVTRQMDLMQRLETRTFELNRTQDLKSEIEDRKRIEQELVDARAKVKNANLVKKQFLSNMCHELRTPLQTIIGISELLMDCSEGTLRNDQRASYLEHVNQAGVELLTLIGQILDANGGLPAPAPLDLEDLDAAGIAEGCVAFLEKQASKADLKLNLDLSDSLPRLVGDRAKVRQVLFNLLSNSIKFTPPGGEVNISCIQQKDSSIAFQVTDSGSGIDKDVLPNVMKPFVKADYDMVGSRDGPGLGLFLTQKILDQHGGTMEIESRYGHGTRVTVAFPAAEDQLERCAS